MEFGTKPSLKNWKSISILYQDKQGIKVSNSIYELRVTVFITVITSPGATVNMIGMPHP
jgi:hypothetical protein